MKLSPHFSLEEFLPPGYLGQVPLEVLTNLDRLAQLLERGRAAVERPLRVTSGWRLPGRNARIGGASASDHLTGCAADVQALVPDGPEIDPAATLQLFLVFARLPDDAVGQVILEDHRAHYGKPGKLWVHVAVPSEEHKDRLAINRVLSSEKPGQYTPVAGSGLA